MKKIGIIGVGSPFGGDQISYHVIQLLKQNCQLKRIHLHYYDRPGFHLLEAIKDFKIVHLIDAVKSEKPIGSIHRYEAFEIFQNSPLLSTHGLGAQEVLQLGKILDCLPEKIIIHGIEIDNDKRMDCLSNDILNQCDKLVAQITGELANQ